MLWLVLVHVAAADTEEAVPGQGPQDWYQPYGLHVSTASYPVGNIGVQPREAQSFELTSMPDDQGNDLSPAQSGTTQDLFGPNPLGPPNPRDQNSFNFLPQLPEQRGQFGPPPFQQANVYPSLPKVQSYDLPGIRDGVLDGSPDFMQEIARLNRLALGPRVRTNRPMIRPGGQDYPYPGGTQQNGYAPPMNPWYGLPVPTSNGMGPVARGPVAMGPDAMGRVAMGSVAMGPYFQRRPKPISFTPSTVQTPLAPLRDIDHSTRLFDSWLDAQVRGRGSRRPAPEMGPLAPPSMSGGGRGRDPAKLFAPRYSKEHQPPFSRERIYVSVSTSTRRTYVTRGLLQELTETTPRPPPPLLGDEDGLPEEQPPESDVSLFSRERQQRPKLQEKPPTTSNKLLV